MLWMTAWKQTPCGALPDSDELIAARIGMPIKLFSKHRGILMRGWSKATDGRLYHGTLTERVQELLEYRRKELERRTRNRAKPAGVPELSRGTETGQPPDDSGLPDTGTGTGTSTTGMSTSPPSGAGTRYGAVAKLLRQAGFADAHPGLPQLQALADAGATDDELLAMAPAALKADKPTRYLLAAMAGERSRIAKSAPLHRGPLPAAAPAFKTAKQRDAADAAARYHEMTGGLLGNQHAGDVIDMETGNARLEGG